MLSAYATRLCPAAACTRRVYCGRGMALSASRPGHKGGTFGAAVAETSPKLIHSLELAGKGW